jgi:hypothetical protein
MTLIVTQTRTRTARYLYTLKVFETTGITSPEPGYEPIRTI